jgi:hypothetical protein
MSSRLPATLPLIVLALIAHAPAARADGPRFEITPFAGYRFGGEIETPETDTEDAHSVDLNEGGGWGVDLGLYRDDSSFYELLYSSQSSDLDSKDPALRGIDVTTAYYHFGGTIFFAEQNWAVPYLSLTAGATRFDADGGFDSETKFSMSLGGGLRLPFTERFGALVGLRGYLTLVDSDTDFLCVSSGGAGTCLLKSSGDTFFQGEALVGVTFTF